MSPLLRLGARLVALYPGVLAGWLLASMCLAEAPLRATPKVLAIDEAHAAVARVQVRSYIFEVLGDRIRIYSLKEAQPDGPADKEYEPVPVDITDLRRRGNVKLADQVRPLRMGILAGSFPYQKQLDEFCRKLRLDSHAAVLAERSPDPDRKGEEVPAFRFLGVEVQRQTLTADGKEVLSDWEKIDLRNTYRPFVFLTGKRFEPEQEKYRPVLVPGLVMPRLLAFKGAAEHDPYPDVAGKLENVAEVLAKLEPVPRPDPRFITDNFDPFNPEAPVKPPPARPVLTAPEHCLVRVIDITIQPGFAYRYRLRVRMANPNYRRKDVKNPADARDPALKPGPWFVLEQLVRVPPELHYYAVDQHFPHGTRTRIPPLRSNQTALQMHRWLDTVKTPDEFWPVLVGEWVVAERVPVYKGEYVGQDVPVKFPVWRYTRDEFVIAGEGDYRRGRPVEGIPVDFGLRRKDGLEMVLVDFEGGSARTEYGGEWVLEDYAEELLFLTPDGKLLARNSASDGRDEERIRRLKLVRQRLTLLKRR